jgi:glycosyltransferase involved in cell wall biosynthesis
MRRASATTLRRPVDWALRTVREYRDRLPAVPTTTGPGTGTVYFLTPDFDRPAGGLRIFYRHVDALNAAGIDAAILHSKPGFACTWFEHSTRIADTSSAALGASDLLVVPELYAALLPDLPAGVRHVIFNQGPFLTFERDAERVARHYASSPDLLAVLTVSHHGVDLLSHAFPGRDVRLVRNAVDPAVFHPGDAPGGRTIAYMPRRGKADAELVVRLLQGSGGLDSWAVRELEGLTQAQVAGALRESSIFLSFPYQEGFGLPAVEAMACGNLVIGYDGMSGREFFLPEFSRPIPTGDVLAFARAVEDAIARERREPGFCRAQGLAASRHVLDTYRPEHAAADVAAAFHDLLGREPEPVAEEAVAHA